MAHTRQFQCTECGWFNHGHSQNCSKRNQTEYQKLIDSAEYLEGYNAYCLGEGFKAGASREWAKGYEDALADSTKGENDNFV